MLPDLGITLDLGVSFYEEPVIPGIGVAGIRSAFVIEAEIADDLSV